MADITIVDYKSKINMCACAKNNYFILYSVLLSHVLCYILNPVVR